MRIVNAVLYWIAKWISSVRRSGYICIVHFHEWFVYYFSPRSKFGGRYGLCPISFGQVGKNTNEPVEDNEILPWLSSKAIHIARSVIKAQLVVKDRELKSCYISFIADMARAAGPTILRLPPYHCELNPIELAWTMIKGYVKQPYKVDDVLALLNTAIKRFFSEN